MNSREEKLNAFGRLLDVMDELREKCPWDKKQTMESLRHLTIEETYELCDAILDDNMDEVKKELGDLLLHMVFYAKIGSERKSFDIADVLNGICDKLIFRHPHIYGDVEVQNEEEVKQNWEKFVREVFSNFFGDGGAPMHKTKKHGDRDLSAFNFSAQYDAWSSKKIFLKNCGKRQNIGKNR